MRDPRKVDFPRKGDRNGCRLGSIRVVTKVTTHYIREFPNRALSSWACGPCAPAARSLSVRMSQPSETTTVWVPRNFLGSDRVRSYHWDDRCSRAPERGELVEAPYAAVRSSPRLKACPACAPAVVALRPQSRSG